ncbi:MAG: OmpH family outer membrane protein [Veillonellaceae bacterium]|nr:OmpH family outer membrane protein [Veillonellaceae bacterium]
MKKQMYMAAIAGVLALGVSFGAEAAGLGYVNRDMLVQAHPKFTKTELTIRTDAEKQQQKFEKESAKLETEDAKRELFFRLQEELMKKQQEAMAPILQDIQKAIDKVRVEKQLDAVVDYDVVVSGGVDITPDVQKKL